MSKTALAILALAILVSAGMWLSVRAAGLAEIQLLPSHYRRRVQWWQSNARHVQFGCAAAVCVAAALQLSTSFG